MPLPALHSGANQDDGRQTQKGRPEDRPFHKACELRLLGNPCRSPRCTAAQTKMMGGRHKKGGPKTALSEKLVS